MPPDQQIYGSGNIQAGGDVSIALPAPSRMPSLLAKFIPRLADASLSFPEEPRTAAYDIADKIGYNDLNSSLRWVQEYSQFGRDIDRVYAAFDGEHPNARRRIMRNLRQRYLNLVVALVENGEGEAEISLIRRHSDSIIRWIAHDLVQSMRVRGDEGVFEDDVEAVAMMVVVHGFIHCQILEAPPLVQT